MLDSGDGVEQNSDEASRWFLKAGEQGMQFNLLLVSRLDAVCLCFPLRPWVGASLALALLRWQRPISMPRGRQSRTYTLQN